jgi:CHAT domain-containing protein
MVREREELRRIPAAARQRTWAGEPLRLADIRGLLDSETLLLVYALGPEHSFAWLVGQDVFEKCWLPPRKKIVQLARAVHASLQDSRRVGARHQGRLHARALSDVLLGPFAGRLGRKRLLIVSDDVLQYVPFAVLPVVPSQPPRPAGDATDGRVLLLAEHEVLCVPSGSVLAHLRREAVRRARPPRVAAVFADPVFHAKDERLAGGGGAGRPSQAESSNMSDLQRSASAVGLRFVRLPWSRNEAQAILERVRDSTAFGALDFDASRETVLSAPLHEFGVVHFATHGIINADEPSLSGIVLSLVDSDGRVQDGFLRPHDIERLDLRADLVVLSACRTALGHEVDGEGIVGLTQAFLRAGALRVLVSLWNVGDHTTAELMRRFYDGLLVKKLPPAAALRQAQLSMANDRRYAAPANWAGFVLEGDW